MALVPKVIWPVAEDRRLGKGKAMRASCVVAGERSDLEYLLKKKRSGRFFSPCDLFVAFLFLRVKNV